MITADELFQFLTILTSAFITYYAVHYARRLWIATAYEPTPKATAPSLADRIDRLERETYVGDYTDGDPLADREVNPRLTENGPVSDATPEVAPAPIPDPRSRQTGRDDLSGDDRG